MREMSSDEWAKKQRDSMIQKREHLLSDERAKKQRDLMIQQGQMMPKRENMMNQPGKAWAETDGRDRMNQSSQYGANMMQKCPFVVNADDLQKPPHMMMQSFMGNMMNSPFEKMQDNANNRSPSPMAYHPFGISDLMPQESPSYMVPRKMSKSPSNMRRENQSYGW